MSDDLILASGGKVNAAYLEHAKQSFLRENQFERFIDACGRPLRKSIRVNTLKSSITEFESVAKKYQWTIDPIPWCSDGFWVDDSKQNIQQSLGNTPEHIQGLFYIQEASSMLPPIALLSTNANSSPIVLDMAAAPGSKTTQLAAILRNKGLVVANELSASRLKSLHNNLVRCGILNTAMSHHDGRKFADFVPESFDYILLDAPCGGEGTVRKDIHALENWDLEKVKEIGRLQQELILSAYQSLKPGGKLVYSTCTLSVEENQDIANYLLENTQAQIVSLKDLFPGAEKSVTQEGYLHVLPHTYDSEGFFVSCFVKPEFDALNIELKAKFETPFEKISKADMQRVTSYYKKHFGINFESESYQLLQRQKEVWVFPAAINEINLFMKINRAGMKIAEVYPNKIRSSHEFAFCFGQNAGRQIVHLNDEQLKAFMQGQGLQLEGAEQDDGEVLLFFNSKVVGLGQKQKSKVKNGYPKELVKDGYRIN